MAEDAHHPDSEKQKEQQEKLVVSVSQAVVYKCAVMVEFLNTSIAEITVHRVFRSQVFAVNANIVQMVVFMNQSFQQAHKVTLLLHIAWVNQGQAVKQD